MFVRRRLPRRGRTGRFPLRVLFAIIAATALASTTACAGDASVPASPTGLLDDRDAVAATIVDEVEQAIAEYDLRAAIVRVTQGDDEIVTQALGESMPGVPATTDMHFRSGAVSIAYVATVLLQLVDDGTVALDDRVSTWLPDVPHSDRVTLGQLAHMTSGYADYVLDEAFLAAVFADPLRQWTPEEVVAFATSKPLVYEPGTNWNYSHTSYVLLGLALERITQTPLDRLLAERILTPLGLDHTTDPGTPELQQPVLHAFTSERRGPLGIPADVPFVEESTYWNPSWTLPRGAIQNTNIVDLATTARAIGTGTLLSPASHAAQLDTSTRGFASPLEGCGSCFAHSERYTYGLGVVLRGDWILQNPMYGGYSAVTAYSPSLDLSVAVVVTFAPEAYADDGDVRPRANDVFAGIVDVVAPGTLPAWTS